MASATLPPEPTATVEPSPSAAPAIKLGLMAPFSGAAAAFGQEALKGAQVAVDEVNGAGGLNGRRLTLDQGDDKADPTAATAAAQRLVADGVAAVVGPITSAAALAAESGLNQAKVPLITPGANDPRITDQALPFVFRATGRWDQEPAVIAEFLLRQPSTAKIAIAADASPYGQALAAAMRQALVKAAATPVADEAVDSGTKDFGPLAAKLKAAAPGAVFFTGYAAAGAELAKALKGAGVQTTLAMGDAGEDQALITAGGQAVEGTVLAYPPDPKQVASAAAFLDGYRRRYGTPASLYAISTYDTVRLVADALRRAGSLDGQAVRQALAATSGFDGVYWGKMSFDAKGDLAAKTYVAWQVHAGKFEQAAAAT